MAFQILVNTNEISNYEFELLAKGGDPLFEAFLANKIIIAHDHIMPYGPASPMYTFIQWIGTNATGRWSCPGIYDKPGFSGRHTCGDTELEFELTIYFENREDLVAFKMAH